MDCMRSMRRAWWYVLLSVAALLLILAMVWRGHSQATPHSVTLTWNPPAARTGVTLAGYNVYRRTDESPFVKIAEKVPGPSYEDQLVGSGRKYVYVVTSVDTTGRESRYSAPASAEIP
jgi:fibronectin type 3 domain-containing protein